MPPVDLFHRSETGGSTMSTRLWKTGGKHLGHMPRGCLLNGLEIKKQEVFWCSGLRRDIFSG